MGTNDCYKCVQNFRVQSFETQGSVVDGPWQISPYDKCGKLNLGECHMGTDDCYKCGQTGVHFLRECSMGRQSDGGKRAQSSSIALPNRSNQMGATSGIGQGPNCLYVISNCRDQENSPDVVIDPGVTLSFVTLYVAVKFGILPM
ncbi:uncharacterized protein LOC129890468 [Solanum dulcamara]|uniref:uncharacterized protein LOC129890468 n=1 Tax=Solanum dulcamara TaxID=45834 RepID=UPI002486120F|nr:uncharacterized protein LOC129890468 [Solanum dulcamara]